MHISEHQLLEKFRRLPPNEQEEIFHLIEEKEEHIAKTPRRSLMGICAQPGLSISAEEIDEARREMWANFPRDFPEGKE
jgi:hypothetical protein